MSRTELRPIDISRIFFSNPESTNCCDYFRKGHFEDIYSYHLCEAYIARGEKERETLKPL